jgi:hypothetical protein
MRRFMLPLLVFVLPLVIGAAGLLVWREYPWLLSKSYVLRVATPPLSDAGGKLIAAFKRELANEHPMCSLKLSKRPA